MQTNFPPALRSYPHYKGSVNFGGRTCQTRTTKTKLPELHRQISTTQQFCLLLDLCPGLLSSSSAFFNASSAPPARVQLSELFERLLQFFVAQSPLIAGAPRKTVQFSSKLRHREKRMKIPLLVTLVGLAISFTSCSPTSGYNGRIQGASGPGSVGTNPSQRGIYPGNPNGAGRGFFFALGNGQSIAP